MIIDNHNLEENILIIAEIGNNHEGRYDLAEKMIYLAAEAGAGAVKFQTFQTEFFISPLNKDRFERFKKFELSFDEFEKLKNIADNAGVMFLSTPFDIGSATFLNDLVPAYKISSSDNTFYPLLEVVAKTGKPILLSTGLAEVNEIKKTKALIETIWKESGYTQELAALHCICAYPASPEEVNLSMIKRLRKELGCTVGYSDHTLGIDAAVTSVALGAKIIEKHFTLDKNFSDFRDHQLSADVDEMSQLVKKVREVSMLLGNETTEVQESERSITHLVRRSVVAAHDIPEGSIIKMNDITWTRPSGGIEPGMEHLVLGKTTTASLKKGAIVEQKTLK